MPSSLPTLLDTFRENPLHFVGPLAVAGLGLALALVALLVLGRAPKATLALGLVALLLGGGAIGTGVVAASRFRAAYEGNLAMPGLTARDRANLSATVDHQAGQVRTFAMLAGSVPALLGVLGLVLGATKKPRLPG